VCDVQVFRRDGVWRRPEGAGDDAEVRVLMWGADAGDGTPGQARAEVMRAGDLPLVAGVTVGVTAGATAGAAAFGAAGNTAWAAGGGGRAVRNGGAARAGGSGKVPLPGLVVVVTEL